MIRKYLKGFSSGATARRISVKLFVCLFALATAKFLGGQTVASAIDLPVFDVISIRPNLSSSSPIRIQLTSEEFVAENVPLVEIIKMAFDIKSERQLSGAPGWLTEERFTIQAKNDEAQTALLDKLPSSEQQAQLRLRLQSMLRDRFHLTIKRETKAETVFALHVVPGELKVRSPEGGTKPANVGPGNGVQVHHGISLDGPGKLTAVSASMAALANVLSRLPETRGYSVIDNTGLKGTYDWSLRWDPENLATDGTRNGTPPLDTSERQSLFAALREQLGLELKQQKGLVDLVVIESVERPSTN
jgi:bla regulator protein BlaR1